ncbi:hypothetical protein [Aquabacter cavernae]|uniref:hypothetical protein n=1 Tax=Aquabacter cavernae TaxID=2496029 RepID=UPI000F8DA56C|nr:hypothetical protein [Aquabacter cavernae]
MTRFGFMGRGHRRGLLRAAPAASLGLVLMGGLALAPLPAAAQEGDGDFFRNVFSAIGLVPDEKSPIQYRERAPLVVPPPGVGASGVLPAPKAGAAATNPNWPKDPDVLRAQAANAEDRTPVGLNGIDQRGQPLLPSQLNNVRHKPTASVTNGAPVGADKRGRDELMPSELGFFGWTKGLNGGFTEDKPLTFTGEPTRETLIDPPPGYQTPAPNAPYGTVEKKQEAFKLPSFFDMQNTSTRN